MIIVSDGGWGDWSDWDECTAPCDGGYQTRLRFCDNPIPDAGGSDCSDTNIDSETKTCNIDLCPTGKFLSFCTNEKFTKLCFYIAIMEIYPYLNEFFYFCRWRVV